MQRYIMCMSDNCGEFFLIETVVKNKEEKESLASKIKEAFNFNIKELEVSEIFKHLKEITGYEFNVFKPDFHQKIMEPLFNVFPYESNIFYWDFEYDEQ